MRKQRLSTRIGAIMVAMTLAVGTFAMSGLSVFAAPPSSEGVKSITIHKYVMEDIRGATIPGSGSAEDVANVPADARPLANVGFKIYKVSPDENDLYPEGKNFTLHKDADGTVDGITENGKLYSAVQEKEELFTDEQGIAKMSELVTGVYLIVEQDSVDPVTGKLLNVVKAAPFLVNAPMTSPDGTNTINDIHVFPKNQATAPTKTPVGGSSVAVGEIKTWKIKMNVPAGMAASQALVITDKLDEALTYQDNSIKLYGKKGDEARQLIPDALTAALVAETNTVTFTVNPDKFAAIAGYTSIELEFNTVINNKILDKATVENNADITFTDQSGITHQFTTPTPGTIHTGTILIKKVDQAGTPLDGAIFHLASSKEKAQDGNYLKLAADGALLDTTSPGYAEAAAWEGTPVAGQQGQVKFSGIKDLNEHDEVNSYWLVETKSPDGYNKLSGPIEVTFDKAQATSANNYTMEKTVENSKGLILPATGGMGTMLFTIGGIIIIGMAGAMLVLSKKKNTSC